jgi:PncC family amidohydrolase
VGDEALRALAERLQGICLGRGLTVAVAESCTGGLVSAALTEIPGSSGYFVGGIVAYADSAKAGLLGVPEASLSAHGAVSAQVARVMATGVRERLRFALPRRDQIAGPDAATPRNRQADSVGHRRQGTDVRRFTWAEIGGNRRESVRASRAAGQRADACQPQPGGLTWW